MKFFNAFLSKQVVLRRHCPCAVQMQSQRTAPRIDAQASENRTGIRRWWPGLDEEEQPDPWESPRFSLERKKSEWPWVYEKKDKPSLRISALGVLAVVIGRQLFQQTDAKPPSGSACGTIALSQTSRDQGGGGVDPESDKQGLRLIGQRRYNWIRSS